MNASSWKARHVVEDALNHLGGRGKLEHREHSSGLTPTEKWLFLPQQSSTANISVRFSDQPGLCSETSSFKRVCSQAPHYISLPSSYLLLIIILTHQVNWVLAICILAWGHLLEHGGHTSGLTPKEKWLCSPRSHQLPILPWVGRDQAFVARSPSMFKFSLSWSCASLCR